MGGVLDDAGHKHVAEMPVEMGATGLYRSVERMQPRGPLRDNARVVSPASTRAPPMLLWSRNS